jgi:Na+/H+-dicarboxylate symporter
MNASKFYALALDPRLVIGSFVAGGAFGLLLPRAAQSLGVIGNAYVDLLKMAALPFMLSAIIFSLQRLLREDGASRLLLRALALFLGASIAVSVMGAAVFLALHPGADIAPEQLQKIGLLVGSHSGSDDILMRLHGGQDAPAHEAGSISDVLANLIPNNIFAALSNGETLKALVFALLFGMAMGYVPESMSASLSEMMETVYHACQRLMHWMSYPLPIVLFCMTAAQLGKSGAEPLLAMLQFVLTFCLACALVMALSVVIIWKRSRLGLGQTLTALRAPMTLALATHNSAICMPNTIESLSDGLGFSRARVELLVPLSITLLRTGQMLYYVCAALFVVQLYEYRLDAANIALVLLASMMIGFASSGITGLTTVSMVGVVCSYLHLPFEAAFVLFVLMEPVCDMLRTLVLVIAGAAVVCMVCERPPLSSVP